MRSPRARRDLLRLKAIVAIAEKRISRSYCMGADLFPPAGMLPRWPSEDRRTHCVHQRICRNRRSKKLYGLRRAIRHLPRPVPTILSVTLLSRSARISRRVGAAGAFLKPELLSGAWAPHGAVIGRLFPGEVGNTS